MTLTNIAVIGGNGKLGPSIVNALLAANTFKVTAIQRASSKSTYPNAVVVRRVSDELPDDELVDALRGKDALVVVFAGSNADLQIRLADAAVKAGIKRFIPADFGSCDSSSPQALRLVPLYRQKKKVRDHLEKLASSSDLTWTSLVCGHFFDYGLRSGLLSFDVKARKARVFDGGVIRWSTTTLDTIGYATARVLQKETETKNRMLYIQDFSTTQNELLHCLEHLTGQAWQAEHVASASFIEEVKLQFEADPSDPDATEEMVSVVGIIDANWEGEKDFANELLGIKGESLEAATKAALAG